MTWSRRNAAVTPWTRLGDYLFVKVKGKPSIYTVHWEIACPIPTIIKGEFTLVNRNHYKFKNGKEWFYAWEEDLTKAKEEKSGHRKKV